MPLTAVVVWNRRRTSPDVSSMPRQPRPTTAQAPRPHDSQTTSVRPQYYSSHYLRDWLLILVLRLLQCCSRSDCGHQLYALDGAVHPASNVAACLCVCVRPCTWMRRPPAHRAPTALLHAANCQETSLAGLARHGDLLHGTVPSALSRYS